MKRILPLLGLFGAAVLLLATPGKTHKVDWCHFPPGQWNGSPANSKAITLSIDEAADGSVGGQHLNHTGDGPMCTGAAQQVLLDGKVHDCADIKIPNAPLNSNCGGNDCRFINDLNLGNLQLAKNGNGVCACPPGTVNVGNLPAVNPNNPDEVTCSGANF